MGRHDAHGCGVSGAAIRAFREYWAYSRAELAPDLGVTAGTIFIWERDGVTCRNYKSNHRLRGLVELTQVLAAQQNQGTSDERQHSIQAGDDALRGS